MGKAKFERTKPHVNIALLGPIPGPLSGITHQQRACSCHRRQRAANDIHGQMPLSTFTFFGKG
jgi:translation elongation factor EF-Tu-like GTPase